MKLLLLLQSFNSSAQSSLVGTSKLKDIDIQIIGKNTKILAVITQISRTSETSLAPTNALNVGTDEMLYSSARSLWSSISIFTKVVSAKSLLNFSNTGAIFLHGGHQDAVKYNILFVSDLMMSENLLESPKTTKLEAHLARLVRMTVFLLIKDLANIF